MTEPLEVDLHKKTREEAREIMIVRLRVAFEKRLKRLVFVHGRGWHSEGKAVLPAFVREWLVRLEQHPRSPIQRLRFGEDVRGARNPGTTIVDLKLHRSDPAFDPDEPGKRPTHRPSSRSHLSGLSEPPKSLLDTAELELRRWMDGEDTGDGDEKAPE